MYLTLLKFRRAINQELKNSTEHISPRMIFNLDKGHMIFPVLVGM
jgi:hypothetical protein